MHKKALYVGKKLASIKNNTRHKEMLQQAYDHLWAGQCNCPYWHGVFGGLYLPHIRHAVYSQMIQAEILIDKLKQGEQYGRGWIDYQLFDFDADGQDELIVESDIYNLYFSPHNGGTLFEMDYKPKAVNLLDTMSRREEGYHRKLLKMNEHQVSNSNNDNVASIHDKIVAKEKDLDKKLFFDNYRRSSLIDHFLNSNATIEAVAISNCHENANSILLPYRYETYQQKNELIIKMAREGYVRTQNNQAKLQIEKLIQIQSRISQIEYKYCLRNVEAKLLEVWFAIEFNVSLLAGNAPDRYYYFKNHEIDDPKLASIGIVNDVIEMGLKDEWQGLNIRFTFDQPTVVWRFPIETISQSEAGFERVYQSSVVFPNWKIQLPPGSEWHTSIWYEILTEKDLR